MNSLKIMISNKINIYILCLIWKTLKNNTNQAKENKIKFISLVIHKIIE